MPYVINWPRKGVLAFAAVCFALLGFAHSASAAQSCPNQSTSQVFAPFGDTAGYVLVHGGSFEANTSWNWSFSSASVVAGNEPWYVGSATDSQSVSMAPGGQAVSAPVCLSATRPTMRFFVVSQDGSATSTLNVSLQYTDSYGNLVQLPITSLNGASYTSWQPTAVLAAGSLLPSGAAEEASLVFQASGGSWQIDDVYVDPYSR